MTQAAHSVQQESKSMVVVLEQGQLLDVRQAQLLVASVAQGQPVYNWPAQWVLP